MLSEALFVVYITDWIISGVPVLTNVASVSKCSFFALKANSTSFFYNPDTYSCILNHLEPFHSTDGLTSSPGYKYYLKSAPRCGLPPVLVDATLQGVSYLNDVHTALYSCPTGFYLINPPTCVKSTWSIGATCKAISTCSDIKSCNPSYTSDGEYWLYPDSLGNQKVKIYCNGMNTTGPREYITLYGTNFAEYPTGGYNPDCSRTTDPRAYEGKTEFLKIRVTLQNMHIIRNDFQFANQVYGTPQQYGDALACSARYPPSTCTPAGKTTLNVTSTGLKISSTSLWKIAGSDSYIVQSFRDDHVIVMLGDGFCGGAEPNGAIKLQIDPSYVPPNASATTPVCG